ncbi:MAG TPA: hypothetical protein VIG08_13430 [Gemmatimonadales bacterium]|jgi:hypothetical protein
MTATFSRRGGFLRDLVFLLGIPGVIAIAVVIWWRPWRKLTEPYRVPEGRDVFMVAAGTWDWEGAEEFCRKNPHTITFTSDRRVMTLRSAEPHTDSAGIARSVTEYEVLEHSPGRIRGAIRGETRRTAGGKPVVWDLVLIGPNTYRWHRTDWPLGTFTKPVRRCPPNAASRHDRVPP